MHRRVRKSEGTYAGDVYSFGIIIYEVCYLLRPYGDKLTRLGAAGINTLSVLSLFIRSDNAQQQDQLYRCTGNALADYRPITDCLFPDASSFNKRSIVTIVKSQWYDRRLVTLLAEFTERYLKLNSIHSFTLSSLLCSVEC